MNPLAALFIGAVVHAIVGAGIFFAKEEPHRLPIFCATILKGMLVALLIALSLDAGHSRSWLTGLGYGALYGLGFGLVVFLAKGASVKTTPYLLGSSVVQGAVSGALIACFALA